MIKYSHKFNIVELSFQIGVKKLAQQWINIDTTIYVILPTSNE